MLEDLLKANRNEVACIIMEPMRTELPPPGYLEGVRALATKELSTAIAARILWKDCVVASTNGLIFAIVAGAVAVVWFGDPVIGVVIGLAMIVTLVVAGASGMLIPLALARAGVDPAVSAGVLLTTVTDVVGFVVFLGLATLILL